MIRGIVLLAAALAGCAVPKPVAGDPVPRRWWLAQATVRDLGAGDARVVDTPVLVLAVRDVEPAARPRRIAVVTHGEEAAVGEEFWLEVTIPRAESGETHRVRIHPDRPGLRLLDGAIHLVRGGGPVRCRAVADSAGTVRFTAEILQ